MSAIPYQSKDHAEPRELVAAIGARRGGALLNLDRMLLHSPPLAQGWNGYLHAIRTELTVSPKLRELAICVVAQLNHADYEYHHHAPEFLREGGTARKLDALRNLTKTDIDPAVFDAAERAVLALAVEMTQKVEVRPANMASLRAALPDDRHVVEIVAVIATYNMGSRFLVALGVEPERRRPSLRISGDSHEDVPFEPGARAAARPVHGAPRRCVDLAHQAGQVDRCVPRGWFGRSVSSSTRTR